MEASTQMCFEWGDVRHYELYCGSVTLLVMHSNKQMQVLSASITLLSVTQTAETKPIERSHKVVHKPS